MNFLIIYYNDGTRRYICSLNIKHFEVNEKGKIIALADSNHEYESCSKILQDQKSWELI